MKKKKYFQNFCYFRTIGVEMTKIGVKFNTNFCYFRTNSMEITIKKKIHLLRNDLEICYQQKFIKNHK